jgi:hypothetical protein
MNNRIYKNKSENNNIINDINGMTNNGSKIIRRNQNYYKEESINTSQNNINTRSYLENNSKTKNIIIIIKDKKLTGVFI